MKPEPRVVHWIENKAPGQVVHHFGVRWYPETPMPPRAERAEPTLREVVEAGIVEYRACQARYVTFENGSVEKDSFKPYVLALGAQVKRRRQWLTDWPDLADRPFGEAVDRYFGKGPKRPAKPVPKVEKVEEEDDLPF